MDITPLFNQVLAQHNAPSVETAIFRVEALDGFLKEAYRIRTHIIKLHNDLKAIRQSYLSTAAQPVRHKHSARASTSSSSSAKGTKHLTDAQRTEVDVQAKQALRELNYAINTLRDAEQIRQATEAQVALRKRAKQGLGALGRWAAGGAITAKSIEEEIEEAKANTIKAHRESIIWCLQSQLEECGSFQSSMMEIRLLREMEKSKSVLHKARRTAPILGDHGGMNGGHVASGDWMDQREKASYIPAETGAAIESKLDEQQLQLFAQENHDMLKQYEDQLDKVQATEKSLTEISELQSTLASNLGIQAAHIERLVDDSYNTTGNVGSGNKELKRATERRSTAQMVFWSTCVFCATLVLWDLFI